MRTPKPDYISRDSITLADAWGTEYRLDSITSVSVNVQTNPADIQFGRETSSGQPEWANDAIKLSAGGWSTIDQAVTKGFQFFRFRNNSAGSNASISFRAFCQGG